MSVFTEEQTTALKEEVKSYVEEVVKTKGNERFRDPEELAKSVLNANDHIAGLEKQLSELREDLTKRVTPEEAQRLVEEKAKELAVQQEPRETNTNVDPENIKSLVTEVVTSREKETLSKRNLEEADKFLDQTYGTEARKEVDAKAAEMGFSFEKMMEIASESPSAFRRLMGESPQKATNQTPSNQVNTSTDSFNSPGEKNYEYWQKLRRDNPSTYYTPKVQREMMDWANKLGDRF